MTVAQPEVRFGSVEFGNSNKVVRFREKYQGDEVQWVNGGFFVCDKKVFDYIPEGEDIVFEKEPLENMAKDGELYAYRQHGFWKCMDTMRDKIQLEKLWKDDPKWRIWEGR
jgi:glucose-1-phosphate cytidylyltransferase